MAAIAQVLDGRNQPPYLGTLKDIKLLSVGTGLSLQYIAQQNVDWGDAQWIKPLLNILMEGSAGVADFQCIQLLGERYYRLAPVFPAGRSFPLDDVGKIVDLIDFARAVDLTGTLAWLKTCAW
jgi:hypothetical protein